MGAPERLAVPAPHVASVMLLLDNPNIIWYGNQELIKDEPWEWKLQKLLSTNPLCKISDTGSYQPLNLHNIISGLSEDALGQTPSDSEIIRFSVQLETDMMRELVVHLGLTVLEWKYMSVNHPHSIEAVHFFILIKWREKKMGIFRDLTEALKAMRVTTHKLCQVGS